MSKTVKLPFPQLVRAFWSPYLKLLGYMTPYRKRFFLGIAFGVLAGIVSGSLTLVILKAGESIGVKIDKSQLMPGAIPTGGPGIGDVIGMSMLIPLVMVLRGLFSYLNVYCLAWVSLRVLRDIRTKLFSHLMSQSLDFFNREKTGTLMSRVMSDTRVTQNALTSIVACILMLWEKQFLKIIYSHHKHEPHLKTDPTHRH